MLRVTQHCLAQDTWTDHAAREAAAAAERERCQRETAAGECRFWFVSAEWLRTSDDVSLPAFQELRERSGVLSQRTIQRSRAFRGEYTGRYLAVSHRWMSPSEPDADGAQLAAVREHVREHPEIEWVWYDYWDMPQGERTPAELVEFKHMLSNVNLLYLGMSVLILLDLSYMSRFW